jgi:DNA-binding winged helix-turn-helix (wHTH) protein
MVFPPYAAPFPDTKDVDITLGTQHRAMLTLMAQRPGHVFTADELAAKLKLPALTPRRAEVLVGDINGVLGDETIATVPRRGWKMTWYEHAPVTLSY